MMRTPLVWIGFIDDTFGVYLEGLLREWRTDRQAGTTVTVMNINGKQEASVQLILC